MSETLQAVKGMNDLLPPDSSKWAFLEKRAREVFERHGYREIRTPIVEYTPLFVRSVGEATDVVEKQMYTFADRDEKSLTMRPEGTASTVRAYLEHSVHKKEPVSRYFYSGPMFRHERAQKGRYRQFYQMGVEAFGVSTPTLDAEQVAMLHDLLAGLGIGPLAVMVNSVGSGEDRPAYRAALVAYFTPHVDELCEDCRRRLTKNPLRILDCKNNACQKLAAAAPSIIDHLGPASRAHFDAFRAALEALGIPSQLDPRLVRGLDYYTATTFEIRAVNEDLGALAGGGRYDKLVEEFGGPPTPAVGFAFGVERVVLALPGDPESFDPGTEIFLASHGDAARLSCLKLAHQLRQSGFRAEMDHRVTSMKTQLKRADRLKAKAVIVIGDAELAANEVTLRDMAAGEQKQIPSAEVSAELTKLLRR